MTIPTNRKSYPLTSYIQITGKEPAKAGPLGSTADQC